MADSCHGGFSCRRAEHSPTCQVKRGQMYLWTLQLSVCMRTKITHMPNVYCKQSQEEKLSNSRNIVAKLQGRRGGKKQRRDKVAKRYSDVLWYFAYLAGRQYEKTTNWTVETLSSWRVEVAEKSTTRKGGITLLCRVIVFCAFSG